MTREQLIMQLQQEYAQRRDENLGLFLERRGRACALCPGLQALLDQRHGAVMEGVRRGLVSGGGDRSQNAGLPERMSQWNQRIAELLVQAGLGADYLQPVYTCPVCRDEGYVYDPSRRMCACFETELNRRMLEASGLADGRESFERFDETLFDDQPDEHGVVQRRVMLANRNICRAYAQSYPDTDTRDLLLMGKSGLGKTFLLRAIGHEVASRGYLPLYVTAYRMFDSLRRAYFENSQDAAAPLMDAPLLLIDDLGTEPLMNNITVTQFFVLINERQLAGRHTVISTNLSMSELRDRYTERVTSRFLDETGCTRLTFVGGDVRRRLRRGGREG